MHGAESWSEEAFEQQRAAALERLQKRIDEVLIAREQKRWREHRPRLGRDHAERASEVAELAEQAAAAPW